MPAWAGKWPGGRYYLSELGKPVYFIERRGYSLKLKSRDELSAIAELSEFLEGPAAYEAARKPKLEALPVWITTDRIKSYLGSIRKTVIDHRRARESYLSAWAELGLDLSTVTRQQLRKGLNGFAEAPGAKGGGFRGRAEAINAFARWLVKEGDLKSWTPITPTKDPEATRAKREAYSLEQLRQCYARLTDKGVRDTFLLRVSTGMHHTELEQLDGCEMVAGPLPDKGVGLRFLGEGHEILAVLQVMHKSRHRHRVSLNAACYAAAQRRRLAGVPSRSVMWEHLMPLVPSNLRHTYVTLIQEVGEEVHYVAQGVSRAFAAQMVGHRAGSTMTADRYDKMQVPPMAQLPLGFGNG